jgi:uncharacterized protein YndB with AHSA1/START domain
MTRDKAQKRATRARMTKTGERYTAARRHVVQAEEAPASVDLGQSDEAVREHTGRGWKEWLRTLDAWGAKGRRHGEIVAYLMEQGVPGWWAQTVTTGYERSRGIRAKHQSLDGTFQVSVSKTLPIDARALFEAFTDARRRNRWFEPGTLRVRKTQKNRTARFDYLPDGSRLVAYFEPKAAGKTTVTIQHERLPDAGAVEEMRTMWKERLGALAESLRG